MVRSAGHISIKSQDGATIAERSDDPTGGPDDSILDGLQLLDIIQNFPLSIFFIVHSNYIFQPHRLISSLSLRDQFKY